MTSKHGNIIAYNTETTEMITSDVIDLTVDPLNVIDRKQDIQFRGLVIHDNILAVTNSKTSNPFIATFECNHYGQWQLLHILNNVYIHNHTLYELQQPYGIAWYSPKQWYIITLKTKNMILILDKNYTIINQINIDTNTTSSSTTQAIRDIAIDNDLGLAFIASESTQSVLVYDIINNFELLYPIDLNIKASHSIPYSVIIDNRNTLYISDKQNNVIYAIQYSRDWISLKWIINNISSLQQPTGLAISDHELYVISSAQNKILIFNISNGVYQREFSSWDYATTGIGEGKQLLYINPPSLCTLDILPKHK